MPINSLALKLDDIQCSCTYTGRFILVTFLQFCTRSKIRQQTRSITLGPFIHFPLKQYELKYIVAFSETKIFEIVDQNITNKIYRPVHYVHFLYNSNVYGEKFNCKVFVLGKAFFPPRLICYRMRNLLSSAIIMKKQQKFSQTFMFLFNKLTSVFHASVLLLIMNFVVTLSK